MKDSRSMSKGYAAGLVPATACSGISTPVLRREGDVSTRRLLLYQAPVPACCLLVRLQLHPTNPRSQAMLSWALAFFIIAIIAAVFGFTGIAAGAAEIAKILFVVFVVLFLVSLVAGLLRRP
jgi:uncharacterized membrane protein YtjA (UPF0391 family)